MNEISKMISKHIALTAKEADVIAECIPIKSFKKGSFLVKEGQIPNESYFVIKGCVRKFYLVEGEEKTTDFYTEEASISSMQSYLKKTPVNHYFECIEDCKLAVLTYEKEHELYERVPGFESLCRISLEVDLAEQQEALATFIMSSPEQRYINLLQNKPELLQRVPQYHLASFLGIKPESLSRIRKRIAKKTK